MPTAKKPIRKVKTSSLIIGIIVILAFSLFLGIIGIAQSSQEARCQLLRLGYIRREEFVVTEQPLEGAYLLLELTVRRR